ncbi:MAG: DMT family transporter [Chloroflexi bacterium]|uniref:DMT family transporter n=1 Tax=Candidatus Chlorohelix allophototropha TaxID=3003348 RepID=A0A8T7MA18_9CHLR|nr:DMT family transporter [Chloroflexota bacterium]WJW68765.1 DMT family transporter [Chloroflexota bacterium L227-S17]
MKAKDLGMLLVLATLWGGSFLFMRVAAPELGPVLLIELRVLIAGLLLLAYARLTRFDLEIRKYWKPYLVIGLLNSALPFTLIATAELHLTAGFAAILNASTPLFGALVAAAWLKEPISGKKGVGLALGLAGVMIVMGWSPFTLDTILVLSILSSLFAATSYGLASVYTKIATKGVRPLALSTCSQLSAALFLLPIAPFTMPNHFPSLTVVLAVTALAVFSTAFAFLLYFRLIANIGPTRTLTVTFLAPVFGVIWGVLLLNEPLSLSTLLGFAVVLSGVGLVVGLKIPLLGGNAGRKSDAAMLPK